MLNRFVFFWREWAPAIYFWKWKFTDRERKDTSAECTLSRESCELLPGNVTSPFVIPRFDLLTIRRSLSHFGENSPAETPARASTTSLKSKVKCTFRATSYARKQHLRTSDNSDSWISLARKITNSWETTPATLNHSLKDKTLERILRIFLTPSKSFLNLCIKSKTENRNIRRNFKF